MMEAMAQAYLKRCETLGTQPDEALLAPINAVFAQLQTRQGDST